MPGRAVLTSPAGTGEISIPSDPNFICTGLVTVAPLLGSTKNTRAFFGLAAVFFMPCAPTTAPLPATTATTSSASCFLQVIPVSFRKHILASKPFSESAFAQPSRRRLEDEDAIGKRARIPLVGGRREHRGPAPGGNRAHLSG